MYIKLVKKKYVEFILILSINRWALPEIHIEIHHQILRKLEKFNNNLLTIVLPYFSLTCGFLQRWSIQEHIYLFIFMFLHNKQDSLDTSCLSWQCWLRLTQNNDNTSSYWTYNSLRHPPSFVQPTCPDSLGQRSARTVTQQLWYNYWFRNCNPLNYSILAKLIILQWHVSAVEKWFQSVSLVKIINLG